MTASAGMIRVKRLPDGGYRATCPMWPDCTAVAATEEEAREMVELAIEQIVRRQLEDDACP